MKRIVFDGSTILEWAIPLSICLSAAIMPNSGAVFVQQYPGSVVPNVKNIQMICASATLGGMHRLQKNAEAWRCYSLVKQCFHYSQCPVFAAMKTQVIYVFSLFII